MCNYYPLTASITLFANILQNPTAPSATSDIALMHCVSTILARNFSSPSSPRYLIHMQMFKELIRIAAVAAAKARGVPPDAYLDPSQLAVPVFALAPDNTSPDDHHSCTTGSGSGSDSAAATPCSSDPASLSATAPPGYVPCGRFQPPFSTPSPASPSAPLADERCMPPYLSGQRDASSGYGGGPEAAGAFPLQPPKAGQVGLAILPGAGEAYSPDYSDIGPGPGTVPAQTEVDLSGFDFNSYQWQGGEGFAGLETAGQGTGEMAGFGMGGDGGMGDASFMPMVFQWDLADIWPGREFGGR